MNKILIDNNIISDVDGIRIDGNVITFLESGNYEVEYVNSGQYEVTFVINNDVHITEYSSSKNIKIKKRYIINNGKLDVTKFYNNLDVNEVIDIDLCNDMCKVDYKFSNICRGVENYIINVNHNSMNTESNIINKSIALKNSKINYVVNSNVLKDSLGSVLNQNTRIVTLGECDAKISPNMFIDLDDVEAKHGSIIGTFKEDDIFYLMSKGINYNDSVKLLIKGYLFSNIELGSSLRQRIMDIINTYWR